jgi:hypothetical protein
MTNLSTSLKFLAAVFVAAIISLPLTLLLALAGVRAPLLTGYIFPFFYAVTSEGASIMSSPGIPTLTELVGAGVAYSIWLRHVHAQKSTVTSAAIAVLIMAIVNFLWMSLLGLSVISSNLNIRM